MRRFLIAMALVVAAGMSFAQGLRSNLLNRRNRQQSAAAKQEAQPQMTREDLKSVQRGTNGVPALAFNQAPLDLVLEAYAAEVGKTIIPAPDLPKSTITLRSLEGQTLSKAEYLEAIEVTLTMNGVVLEPRGEKFLRALPRKTVRTHGIALRVRTVNLPQVNTIVLDDALLQGIETLHQLCNRRFAGTAPAHQPHRGARLDAVGKITNGGRCIRQVLEAYILERDFTTQRLAYTTADLLIAGIHHHTQHADRK